MKKSYLVVYDYGMGGLWGYVHAESPDEITKAYPELTVLEDTPSWMPEAERARIEADSSEDIETPGEGILGSILGIRAEQNAQEHQA